MSSILFRLPTDLLLLTASFLTDSENIELTSTCRLINKDMRAGFLREIFCDEKGPRAVKNPFALYQACIKHRLTLRSLKTIHTSDPAVWIPVWPREVVFNSCEIPGNRLEPSKTQLTEVLVLRITSSYDEKFSINASRFPRLRSLTITGRIDIDFESIRTLPSLVIFNVDIWGRDYVMRWETDPKRTEPYYSKRI